MDGIKEMLDRLSELNEGELSDLESKIIGEFESVEKEEPTAQVVDSMTALADALDAVRGEQTSRVTAQHDLERRAAEAAARVKPLDQTDQQDGTGQPADGPPAPEVPPGAPDMIPADIAPPPDATAPVPDATAPADGTPPPGDSGAPAGDNVPADQTEAEKKKKQQQQAAPSTFESAEPAAEAEAEAAPTEPDETAPAVPVEPAARLETTPPAEVVVTEPAATSIEPSAQHEEIPVAASATDVVVAPPAENRPIPRQSASVAITAGADIPGISAGTELTSASQVTDAFIKRLHNLSRVSSPNGQQYTVATLTAEYPDDRVLQPGDTEGNWQKIQDVAGVSAIVAAAGSCVPLEIRYDIYGVGSTDTPVRDSLPSFTADRGGIRFYPGPLLPAAGYNAGMGVWYPAAEAGHAAGDVRDMTGAAVTPANQKPCYSVQCLPFTEAVLEAVTMCLCFDNLTGRVFPELVSRHNEMALIQHARITEQYMLGKIKAGATNTITATGVLGAAREILAQVDKVASVLRYRNRISPTQSFRAIFPYWLHDMIRADISYQMPGDGLNETMALADAALNRWFSARNINVTWSLESAMGVTAVPDTLANIASSTGGFPATVEWDIFAEGAWLVLDGGTLDLGVIRDSTHVANNTYCEFSEAFYNAVRVGGESVHVTSTLSATGEASALTTVT